MNAPLYPHVVLSLTARIHHDRDERTEQARRMGAVRALCEQFTGGPPPGGRRSEYGEGVEAMARDILRVLDGDGEA